MLPNALTLEMIQIGVHVNNWQEAVRQGGELLVKAGKVEPSYVDAMVSNIEELGPYMIIAPKVVLPHARPEDGVKQIGISIMLLDEPVAFGEEQGQEVQLVISLAATDATNHIEVLKSIAEVISSEEKLNQIMTARSKEDIKTLFEEEGR